MAKKNLTDLRPGCSYTEIESVICHEHGEIKHGHGDHDKVYLDGKFITPIPAHKCVATGTFKKIIKMLIAAGFIALLGFMYLQFAYPDIVQAIIN
jgi:hypothetical protein